MPQDLEHYTSKRFWQGFYDLPLLIQARAVKQYSLMKLNPFHPSLRFKQKGAFWSVRVNDNYRALAVQRDNGVFLWVWIGEHNEYERLLKQR